MPSDPESSSPEVDAPPKRIGWANDTSLFTSRVVVIFATKIAQFVMGGATLFLIAALLGSDRSGEYNLLLVWTGMLFAFGQLGMPSAMTFMAGRGGSVRSLERIELALSVAISLAIAVLVLAALPWLKATVLHALAGDTTGTSDELLLVVLAAV